MFFDVMPTFQEALNSGTGKGVKIGVLDTGVADLDFLNPSFGGYYRVVDRNREFSVIELSRGEDPLSHGTAIADIIHRHAPDATLYSVQVMDYRAENSKFKLAAGIHFGVDQGWDILNLSVGTQIDFPRLKETVELASQSNCMVVTAVDCDGETIGYPANYESVISVDYDLFEESLDFGFSGKGDITCHGVFVDSVDASGMSTSLTGSSYACPHLTALAARARQFFPDLTSAEFLRNLKAVSESRMILFDC